MHVPGSVETSGTVCAIQTNDVQSCPTASWREYSRA